MLLHSEKGKCSCTLDPNIKTPCCLTPRYGELPCEAKTTSKSSFLFSFHELYCRPVSFLLPGWLTSAELWCGAGPVHLSHPWSTAARWEMSSGHPQQLLCQAQSFLCPSSCQSPANAHAKLSTQGASGTLEDHRGADWPLPCQSWTIMR